MTEIDYTKWPFDRNKEVTVKNLSIYQEVSEKLNNNKRIKINYCRIGRGEYFIVGEREQLNKWIEKYYQKSKEETDKWFAFIADAKSKGKMYADGLIFSIVKPKIDLAEKEPTNENKFDVILSLNCFADGNFKFEETNEEWSKYVEP